MSAPDTNTKTQEKQHRAPLNGMKIAVGFALLLLIVWVGWEILASDGPEGAQEQIDGRTGEVEQVEGTTSEEVADPAGD
ncbi:hypothetical protein SAMN05421688_0669 [Poseidonocella pacifica]|uniref:Uncharacterized protein n=1 Tax=Poseidonocella pacifica TaxID=871651 RepID=A0A1I0VIG0_9RHOB|nr:hypothetical protein [Poseidonocella pacifica]SFA76111.1 hypothetical protein SAMN05421688_0669 [Poseidonocella pacifica]